MLFDTIKLKPGVEIEDVEMARGEMCNLVKDAYGGDKGGFIAGQVFKFSGLLSKEGSSGETKASYDHMAIVTFRRSFAEHEKSHADHAFKEKLATLAELCTESKELATKCFGRAHLVRLPSDAKSWRVRGHPPSSQKMGAYD